MEAAKLVLEYLRVLIWPAVVAAFLIGFRSDVGELSKRVLKVPTPFGFAEFATGQLQDKRAPSGVPDVWFELKQISLEYKECINRAGIALDKSGFRDVRRGGVAYGYTDRFVGAVWCSEREGTVLLTVAGPNEGLQDLHSKLVAAFSAPGP